MQKHDHKNKTVVTLNCSNGRTIKRNYPKKKRTTKLQLYLNINNKHAEGYIKSFKIRVWITFNHQTMLFLQKQSGLTEKKNSSNRNIMDV